MLVYTTVVGSQHLQLESLAGLGAGYRPMGSRYVRPSLLSRLVLVKTLILGLWGLEAGPEVAWRRPDWDSSICLDELYRLMVFSAGLGKV